MIKFDDIIFMNAISHFKILKETCIDIEAYEKKYKSDKYV